jgi:tetratricopeptide (TPR) repeat protein
VFLGLAIVFAVSFAALGVGSGGGSSLSGLYSGLFGSSSNAVSKAQAEIKAATTPAATVKGYRDLANAYIATGNVTSAISTLKTGTTFKKPDYALWSQLGALQRQQGDTYAQQYSQLQQATQLQSPSSIIEPGGALAGQLGTNQIDQYYSQVNSTQTQQALQNAVNGYKDSLTSYQAAAKYTPRGTLANAELAIVNAAHLAGDNKVELKALKKYVVLTPNTPNLSGLEKLCTQLGGSCVPKSHKK